MKNPIALLIIAKNRSAHLVRERKRLKTLEETIAIVRKEHEKSIARKMPHYERIHNVGLYVLLLEYDLAMLRSDALFAIRPWKKNFIARQMASQIYEASHDIPELLGKDFRESLKTLPLRQEELDSFNKTTKLFNEFKIKNRIFLNEVRNFVSSHRDKSANKQLEVLDKIDLIGVLKIAGDFYVPMRGLVSFITKVTAMLGNWNVILKHLPVDVEE